MKEQKMTTINIPIEFKLKFEDATCVPRELLQLDKDNPRLQIGDDVIVVTDEDIIRSLSDIAVLDELVTSICTNKYLNLEPMIVIGENDTGPFKVLEGNRRLAAIKLICDPVLAKKVGVKVPQVVSPAVLESIEKILAYRVKKEEDSRAFIGFKHINGPQRWDAYAKARYVTDWYKSSFGKVTISEMADKMGDNNNTLRSYVYSLLILEQAENAGIWTIKDRANNGRFAFSHFYTALGRKEYQEFLGIADGWSDSPPLKPLDNKKLAELGEVLGYVYGAKSEDRPALVRSQNPDLKNVGLAIAHPEARLVLKNRGTLEEALDVIKDPSDAFYDAIIQANIKIARAIKLMPKYAGGKQEVDSLVDEIFEQADTLKTMNDKKKKKTS
jgi:hypothetical protein